MYLLPPRHPLYNIQVMSDYNQCVFRNLRLSLLSRLNGIKRIFINLNYKKSLSVFIYLREYLVAKSEITIGDKFPKIHAPRLAWTVTNIKKIMTNHHTPFLFRKADNVFVPWAGN